jgi:hypothetical protein
MSREQGPRFAGMRPTANAAERRQRGRDNATPEKEGSA